MRWEKGRGLAYTILKIRLEPGEEVTAEPGAMMLVKGEVSVRTSSGGLLRGLARRLMGGESIFLNTYRAVTPSEVWLVPPLPGDIEAVDVNGEWVVQDASYLAHYGSIEVSVAWRGLRGLIAEGELVWLKVKGRGVLWVSSYGAVERLEVGAGEKVLVDNAHFVAMPAGTSYKVRKMGGLKTFVLGGEGFVLEVRGPTTLLLQTRTLPPLAEALARYLPGGRR